MEANFPAALAFVWAPGRDSPVDGYHVTPNDPGGATFGGVTQATWDNAVQTGVVAGALEHASIAQLTAVMKKKFWDPYCAELSTGVDLLCFNGCMMTGRYPSLFQETLGMVNGSVDGWIGKHTQAAAAHSDPATLIMAVHGIHDAYLRTLSAWPLFGGGWSARLEAARLAALQLIAKSKTGGAT